MIDIIDNEYARPAKVLEVLEDEKQTYGQSNRKNQFESRRPYYWIYRFIVLLQTASTGPKHTQRGNRTPYSIFQRAWWKLGKTSLHSKIVKLSSHYMIAGYY